MKQVQDGDRRDYGLGEKKTKNQESKPLRWKPCPHHPDYWTDGVSVVHKDNVPLIQ